jgi:hypothetical protein
VLQGGLTTFPLPDLLQWIDHGRRSGVVELDSGDAGHFWFQVDDRRIVAAARPDERSGLGSLAGWQYSERPEGLWPEACFDRLLDLFLAPPGGRFAVVDAAIGFDDGVALNLGVGQVTLEGLRRLDEWPELDRRYPSEAALLQADGRRGHPRTAGQHALLEAARRQLSIGEARLALHLSRPAALRRIEALRELGLVHVEGVAAAADPVSSLIDKAQLLVAERQFDEASIVFRSLLAADPSDRRVRNLLREAEREQVAALYEELSPMAVAVLLGGPAALESPAARRLTTADREIAGRVNGSWDVASIALASPLREVETLKAIRRLVRQGLLDLIDPR